MTNGGIVLCFTAATPEVGIDADVSTGLQFNGGTIVSFGSATDMAYGSSGSQKTYRSTSVSAITYAGKHLKMTGGTKTVYAKVPSMSSTSGTLSLVCTTDGCTSSSPSAVTIASSVTNIVQGLCAGCTTMTSVDLSSSTIVEVPSDAFNGCTTLTLVKKAALAGVPFTSLALSSDVVLKDYAFAAQCATEETEVTWNSTSVSSCEDLSFLGRTLKSSLTLNTGEICRVEAYDLMEWLMENADVEQPASYNTADLETWLANEDHAGAYSLDDTFDASHLAYSSTDADGTLRYIATEETATCFARFLYSQGW